jgi:hypothetical protein
VGVLPENSTINKMNIVDSKIIDSDFILEEFKLSRDKVEGNIVLRNEQNGLLQASNLRIKVYT